MIGFVFRICSDFDEVHHLMKILYFAHVRFNLEYASVVWYSNCCISGKMGVFSVLLKTNYFKHIKNI